MVVDDDPAIRGVVSLILKRSGYEVCTAESGFECLELLRQRPDFKGVLLMDVEMPGKSGWETVREMVRGGQIRNKLVVMLTGQVDPGSDGAELEEWVLDYLAKPFDHDTLVDVVQGAWEHLKS